jgi:gamma-aminobutyric acid type B receptor
LEFGPSNSYGTRQNQFSRVAFHFNFIRAGVIYGFKGLILVFGLFLAYETRSIKVKQINDSRYVGMSIYNIAVLCLITAPVAMVIASQQDASFAFVALAVIFCCFLSMLLIFVPKVSKIIQFSCIGKLIRADEFQTVVDIS